MKLKFRFTSPNKDRLLFPIHYNHIVQSFIYRNLNKELSFKLHEFGFVDELSKRRLKFFTFSRLLPTKGVEFKDGNLCFYGPVVLVVASPMEEFMKALAKNILTAGNLRLGNEELVVESVEVEAVPEYQERILVRTLSPITVYSTLKTPDNKKKTYYYSPFEKEFEELLIKNLYLKFRLWYDAVPDPKVHFASIKPYRVKAKDQRIVVYKHTVIKGWDGVYELSLHPQLFNLAFDTGLGAKNSLGFGCIEPYMAKGKESKEKNFFKF